MGHHSHTAQNGNAQQELVQQASFSEQIIGGGPGLAVLVSGHDTGIIFANALFYSATGYSAAGMEGSTFASLLEPAQQERFLMQLKETRENIPSSYSFVIYLLLLANGGRQPFYLYASYIGAAGSHADVYSLLLLPDMSRRGMPFTSLDTKELFLEHFDAEHFGTFERMIDADRSTWSTGIYKIFEVDESVRDIDYQFTLKFVHPQDVPFVKECIRNAVNGSSSTGFEFRIITERGNIKVLHCLTRVIVGKNGNPVKFVGSVRDITAERAIEEHLKNKMDELHHSNSELEEFAYAASHDMQEPLRKITTFSDRLSEKYKEVLEGEGAMYLTRMAASAESMRLLINSLLEFSKITKTSAAYEAVNLNTIIQQVMSDLELKMEETATVIHCGNLPQIDAVPSQMKQLFANLISNAIKFHKQGVSPVITIQEEPLSSEEKQSYNLSKKQYYKIVVADNGIGFEQEYASRIFQVFQRLHGKSEYPGSGIGLAICKKILEFHHGIIYAENVEGIGARFAIIIPENQ